MSNQNADDFTGISHRRPRNAGGWVTEVTLPHDDTTYYVTIPSYPENLLDLAENAPVGTTVKTKRGMFVRRAADFHAKWLLLHRDLGTPGRVESASTLVAVLATEYLPN